MVMYFEFVQALLALDTRHPRGSSYVPKCAVKRGCRKRKLAQLTRPGDPPSWADFMSGKKSRSNPPSPKYVGLAGGGAQGLEAAGGKNVVELALIV